MMNDGESRGIAASVLLRLEQEVRVDGGSGPELRSIWYFFYEVHRYR